MSEHTEVPWFVGKDYYGGVSIRTTSKQATNITGENAIFENTGRSSGDISIEDAEFIVQACNIYKDLLEACEISEICFRKLADIGTLGTCKHVLLDNANMIKAVIEKTKEN